MNPMKLKWHIVVSEPFSENTYVMWRDDSSDSSDCIIVDPGLEPAKIVAFVESSKLRPQAILNTHGHSDHIAGNAHCKQRWPDCPLIIGKGDAPKLTDPVGNLSAAFGVPITSPPADRTVDEGDALSLAGIELSVIETPGHSCGHVVFVCRQETPAVVVGGDVLFRGGVGRVDFPDSNPADLVHSITQKLFQLPDDTMVLPGHGEVTTIGEEREHNPFVGRHAR
jgi:glyoxylase-like metal-dependent hydrolase (beta-lactamase superfamily II)